MDNACLEERILDQMIKEKMEVTIYTRNGVQIRGIIADQDDFTILVKKKSGKGGYLVYKEFVSTIDLESIVEREKPEEKF